jgi:uncharacterized protein (TIGR02996 family)
MSPETFNYAPQTPLEQAILEDPLDDGPRLVLADYLEENGADLRARLIRSQVRLAQEVGWEEAVGFADGDYPPAHWTPRQVHLLREAICCYDSLRLHHEPLLLRHVRWVTDCFQYRPSWTHWRRGFLHRLSLKLHELYLFGKSFFSFQPFLEVSLTDRAPGDPVRPIGQPDSRRFWTIYPGAGIPVTEARPHFYLPSDLFNIICHLCQIPPSSPTSTTMLFDSVAKAQLYLSVACVVWGRQQAGLPCPDALVSFLLHRVEFHV